MRDQPYNVLFLCTGNSCRSIIAEALMNRLGASRFRAWSAGSFPTGQVNPNALALLQTFDHDTSGFRSKSWDEFSRDGNPEAPQLDFIFTVCDDAAGEVCPFWPGQPVTAHWGMPDPARATGDEAEIAQAFTDTYRLLSDRISGFVDLPLAELDQMSLQKKLDQIGASETQPAE